MVNLIKKFLYLLFKLFKSNSKHRKPMGKSQEFNNLVNFLNDNSSNDPGIVIEMAILHLKPKYHPEKVEKIGKLLYQLKDTMENEEEPETPS